MFNKTKVQNSHFLNVFLINPRKMNKDYLIRRNIYKNRFTLDSIFERAGD